MDSDCCKGLLGAALLSLPICEPYLKQYFGFSILPCIAPGSHSLHLLSASENGALNSIRLFFHVLPDAGKGAGSRVEADGLDLGGPYMTEEYKSNSTGLEQCWPKADT